MDRKNKRKILNNFVLSSIFVLFFVNIAVADDLQKIKQIKRVHLEPFSDDSHICE